MCDKCEEYRRLLEFVDSTEKAKALALLRRLQLSTFGFVNSLLNQDQAKMTEAMQEAMHAAYEAQVYFENHP